MKSYNISVVQGDEFKYVESCYGNSSLQRVVGYNKYRHTFIVVEEFDVAEYKTQQTRFMSTKVYLGGHMIKRYRRTIDMEDINRLKKVVNVLYMIDGTMLYYPDRPFTTNEVIDLVGGWFHIDIVNEHPQRMAAVYYDWNQDSDVRPPMVLNEKASERFKKELFGDVLYVNENCIS